MSEITTQRAEQVFQVFFPHYNSCNEKNFSLSDLQSNYINNGFDIDFYFRNGVDGELKIQHTRVVGNPEKEYREAYLVGSLFKEIRELLDKKNVKASISLGFRIEIPSNGNEKVFFVAALCKLIESKLKNDKLSRFSFSYEDDWHNLSKIAPYLDRLDVRESEDLRVSGSLTFGGAYSVIDTNKAILNAYHKKLSKINSDISKVEAKNTVLLLDCEHTFLDDSFRCEEIEKALSESPFLQIWVMTTSRPNSGAWRIDK